MSVCLCARTVSHRSWRVRPVFECLCLTYVVYMVFGRWATVVWYLRCAYVVAYYSARLVGIVLLFASAFPVGYWSCLHVGLHGKGVTY